MVNRLGREGPPEARRSPEFQVEPLACEQARFAEMQDGMLSCSAFNPAKFFAYMAFIIRGVN
jgi:hypothetical protein